MTSETTEDLHCLKPVSDKKNLYQHSLKRPVFGPVSLQTGVIMYKSEDENIKHQAFHIKK